MPLVLYSLKGAPLEISEIDGNFSYLDGRLTTLEAGVSVEGIAALAVSGFQMSLVGTAGTIWGPVTLPAALNSRGEWAMATTYAVRDLVSVPSKRAVYYCKTDNVSGLDIGSLGLPGSFDRDLAAGYWAKLFDYGRAEFEETASAFGTLVASQKVLQYVASGVTSGPIDLAGSKAYAAVAATASTVLGIYKNGTLVGSITFAIGGTTGTFELGGFDLDMVAGNVLTIKGPSTPDATLADVSVTLVLTKAA